MAEVLDRINSFVWGVPALVLILGVGIYFSISTGFAQLRLLPRAVRSFLGSVTGKNSASFKALCTALAATVGTGNIVGVAGAIAIGGPGSIFWMWICGILGMITKFAEAVLAVCFQHRDSKGSMIGGPMYMIQKGMGKNWKWLGTVYCFLGVIAAFGMGNATQINAVSDGVCSVMEYFGSEPSTTGKLVIGTLLAVMAGVCLLGGARRIGNVAMMLVPFASVSYILLSLGALIVHVQQLPSALEAIVRGAFCPGAVTGGMIGSLMTCLRVGASRGVFTNEAGMGTAAIAHGTVETSQPINQGLMGIMEVFLDTLVICTMTALVILTSGISVPYGTDEGAALTTRAFACTYGSGVSIPIALFLCCFAFATMLGWGLYGLQCARYLFGDRVWKSFVFLQMGASIAGVLLNTGMVWMIAETVNGLMAIPNLIALAALSPVLLKCLKEYEKERPLDAPRSINRRL